jgi:hypothetical protein
MTLPAQLSNARRDLADLERQGAELEAVNKAMEKRLNLGDAERAASEFPMILTTPM